MRTHTIRIILASLIAFIAPISLAQEMVKPESLPQGFVLIVKDETGLANKDNPMYLASSINGWNPADPEYILSGRSDTRWQIVIDQDLKGVTMAFKITLGGWDREELDGSGNAIGNRTLPLVDKSTLAPGEKPVIEISVPEFRIPVPLSEQVRTSGIYRELQVDGDVRRLEVRGGAGGAENTTRDLLVLLPPDYDAPKNKDNRYPVLYMFDGQNLFEQLPGVAGEWNIDQTATELMKRGKTKDVIIVGIPHAGENRIREYMAYDVYDGVEPAGDACLQWVIREVMPRVNRAFRTETGRTNTAIGGASLGGMMALYGVTEYPDHFGSAIVESMPIFGESEILDAVSKSKARPDAVFFGVGGNEISTDPSDDERNQKYVEFTKNLSKKVGSRRVKVLVKDDASHNEDAWAERFGDAFAFIFPAR
jgi:predicted alpha/beta superfamily hydrolase